MSAGQNQDRALQALCILARLHHIAAEPHALRHELGLGEADPVSRQDLLLAAKHIGLKAKASQSAAERLSLAPLPALAVMNDGRLVVLAQCDGQRVLFMDPGASAADPAQTARPTIEPLEVFASEWSGELILASSRASLAGSLAKFDFSWFVPAIVKHRKLLGEVLLVSLFLQLFALVSPLFFQVVMDKVLVHKGVTTLDVIVIGLVVIMLFESVLTVLRTYVFSHTTSRIDVELGARLFRHLLNLPLAYFQARRVGDSVARVRELENIRQFLTGNALTLVLDVAFSVIFIAVMFAYSVPLTLIVLASLPLYLLLSLTIVPVLRGRLNEKFARGAENQSLLVETVTGIQTVKAGALEPQMARRWDAQLAAYVSASLRTQTLAQYGNEGINLTAKLVNAATLWYGAHLVMAGELTVGMFVAFNMFAGRVAQPIMRIAQMWTDFQQTGLSMERLGDILNTRTELPPQSVSPLPRLQGRVTLDNLTFRYRPDAPPVLQGVSLDVAPGELIGIVGRSGSGKSTLTKLVQRLYVPEAGRVLVDGHDIALIDAAQLRRQVGVVLQENMLFNRSVRENIAIADPAAPLDAVIHAARLAGAHEFITELPQGYDTVVGEQGNSLSGGQRQRVAIARALFTQPRILIFDEATSALDYESEAVIQKNTRAICQGRTVFIIAHRLSAVRHAHRIIAMDRGRIVVSQRSKTIQPLETSVVKAIHVKDGDKVRAGDLLIELDSTLTAADSARVGEERSSTVSESLRSQALLAALANGGAPSLGAASLASLHAADRAGVQAQLQSEWADINAKLAKFAAEAARRKAEIATAEQLVAKLQATLPLAQQREKDFKSLTEQGFVANHAGQDRTRERIELERDLATAQARLQEAKAALTETEQGLNAYRAETQRTLKDCEAQAGLKTRQLAEEGTKADKRNALTRLTAPVAGTVQQLAVHTAGGVVTPAQVLLVLVPDDAEVTAEVVLENKDVGFVRQGQQATIKLETFPYTRYGTVQAEVQSITADAVQDEKRGAIFPATMVLQQSSLDVDGKRIRLAPGMNLTAEIKTGKRRVIDYLLSPVRRHLDESIRER